MPSRSLHACVVSGCPNLVSSGARCPAHNNRASERAPDRETGRLSPSARGYDAAWRRYARQYLKEHPLCVMCLATGRSAMARVVDHIIPHKGNALLFKDPRNHQALCFSCHGRKSATEEGGRSARAKAHTGFDAPPPRPVSGASPSQLLTEVPRMEGKSLGAESALTARPGSSGTSQK
jgi:5-methylcytosine-specific restriction protein A